MTYFTERDNSREDPIALNTEIRRWIRCWRIWG